MRRFSALFCVIAVLSLIGLTACGGGSTATVFGNPAKITVNPTTTSLNIGDVENMNVVVTDNNNNTLFTSGGAASNNVTFTSTNTNAVQVSNNGLICAGTWDNLAAPVVCTPNRTNGVGQATVTVTAGSITSTPITVFVHQPIDRITIAGAPADVNSCISQNATQQLTAQAFNGTTDITSTVGPITWNASTPDVVTVDPATNIATAVNPGAANLTAEVGNFRSAPVPFTVCPVQSISIHVKGAADTSLSLANAATQTLTADVLDSKGATIVLTQSTAGANTAGLTWTATSASATTTVITPLRSAVTSTSTNDATITGGHAGFASIVASCTPPQCNAGLPPVYSNVVTENTTGATATTVFVTGTDTTQLIPIPTSSNTPGTTITLSNQPNSLLIGQDGARALLGSAGGLMVVDANAGTLTGTFTTVPGKVLAIASDGKTAVVSNTATGQVFVGDVTASSFQVFAIPGVTAAAFSTDRFRLYLASPTAVTVITTGTAAKTLGFGATDVTSYTSGSFAYFANNSVPVVATCDLSRPADAAGAIGATLVTALAGGTQVLAAGPNALESIAVSTDNKGCPPSVTNTPTPVTITGTPNQIIPTSDGTRAFITNNTPNLIVYKAADQSVTTIPLTNATASFTGGVTLDGTQLYVGVAGTTPTVHRIDLTTNTDAQQITASSTAFTPNLVAVRP